MGDGVSNKPGMLSFATAGPGTRTTQLFVNYGDNNFLDSQGFTPFAEVLGEGMNVVKKIQSKYQEEPNQGSIQEQGNAYLTKKFPDLSYVTSMEIVKAKKDSCEQSPTCLSMSEVCAVINQLIHLHT